MSLSSQKTCPEFFKVYLPDHCSENIKIPDAVSDHLNVSRIPDQVLLRNCQGKLWPVGVAKTVGGGVFFHQGWSKFVRDNSLQIGEFMVFKFNVDDVVDIRVFGTNGCEKAIALSSETTHTMEVQDQVANNLALVEVVDATAVSQVPSSAMERDSIISGDKNCNNISDLMNGYDQVENVKQTTEEFLLPCNPFFITEMKKNKRGVLNIPVHTREEFGIIFGDSVKLEDPKGRMWLGKVVSWKDGRVWVSDGWRQLCQSNAISEHDALICELMPSANQICQVIRIKNIP